MTTLFFIFVVLVIFHFIAEGIIAPSERSKIRLELFSLRDRIRMAKIDYRQEFDNELFDHLQDHTNKSIHLLHNYTIFGLLSAFKAERKNDPLFEKVKIRMDRFYGLLRDSKVPKIEVIHFKSLLYTFKGFAYNSLGWLPYVAIPFVAVSLVMMLTSICLPF